MQEQVTLSLSLALLGGMSCQRTAVPQGCGLQASPSSPSELPVGCPCQGLVLLLICWEANCADSRAELLHPLLLRCVTGAFSVQHLLQPTRPS